MLDIFIARCNDVRVMKDSDPRPAASERLPYQSREDVGNSSLLRWYVIETETWDVIAEGLTRWESVTRAAALNGEGETK